MFSSPGQKPNEITSCEYASCVTESALDGGAGRPEKRVTARSKLCQKRWTGLVLPLNQPLNSSSTESDQSSTRPKRPIAARSHEACSTSSGNGVVIGTPNGCSLISTSTPRSRRSPWTLESQYATARTST